MQFALGSVGVAALIFGIVEAAKEFGLQGKASRVLVLVLGVFFVGLAQANAQGLLSDDVMQWVNLVVTAVAGGLAAMGYYDFSKKRNGGG
jgi:uncharacterized membrane protein (Fun14 family)